VPTRVLLIRHAHVENPKQVLYGHLPDFHLSAKGRTQAEELGRRLRPENLRLIAHSPLDRARETAEIIAAQLDPPPPLEERPELREAEFSRYLQGVAYPLIPVLRPLWWVHKARRGWLDGDEPVGEMARRVLDVAADLARRYPDQTTALVSHADPLQAAWVVLDGRPETDREMRRKPVQRAGMLSVEFTDGSPALVS
jgi:broad specificity phosphatase PhoE